MSDNAKYYYLKLKDNFFESDNLIALESMKDGYLFSNILLKLYLRSLQYEGRLMLNNRIPFNLEMLANATRHQIGTVERALKVFRELGLVDIMDSGAIYMLDIQNFIGKSSTEAERKKAYRQRIESEKGNIPLPPGQTSRQMSGQMSGRSSPEIRDKSLEIEIEKEKDIVPPAPKDYSSTYHAIVNHLNAKASTQFMATSKETQKLIRARLNEGFKLEDFKKVIDNKCDDWLNDPKMVKFLRPATLFGTKFEGYLNERSNHGKQNPAGDTATQRNLEGARSRWNLSYGKARS